MAETLTVAGVLAGAFFLYLMSRRRTLAGDMEAPMDLERHRAKSEAEMAAVETQVLTEADAGEAAVLRGHFREIATDEQPVVTVVRRQAYRRGPARWQRVAARRRELAGFSADPLTAPVPGRHREADPVEWAATVQRWFAPQIYAASTAFPVAPAEPDPLPPLDFTGEWEAGTFDVRPVGARR